MSVQCSTVQTYCQVCMIYLQCIGTARKAITSIFSTDIFTLSKQLVFFSIILPSHGRRKGGIGGVGRPPLFGAKFNTFPI